jgi:hypothetical protein
MTNQRLNEISEELFFGGTPDRRLTYPQLMEAFRKFKLELIALVKKQEEDFNALTKKWQEDFNAELIALVKKWEENPDDTE